MQVLITTGTAAGSQPIYLPYDKAPVPFGDPLAASLTAATPSIITVPGYIPTVNDAVSVTVQGPNAILATQVGCGQHASDRRDLLRLRCVGGQRFHLGHAERHCDLARELVHARFQHLDPDDCCTADRSLAVEPGGWHYDSV